MSQGLIGASLVFFFFSNRDKRPLSPPLARLAVGPGTKVTYCPGPKGYRDKWPGINACFVVVQQLVAAVQLLCSCCAYVVKNIYMTTSNITNMAARRCIIVATIVDVPVLTCPAVGCSIGRHGRVARSVQDSK